MKWYRNWWHDTPATDKQLQKLVKLKVRHETHISRGEASLLISLALREDGSGPPDAETRVVLTRCGLQASTAGEACQKIAAYIRTLRDSDRLSHPLDSDDEELASEEEKAILGRYKRRFAKSISAEEAQERIDEYEDRLLDEFSVDEEVDDYFGWTGQHLQPAKQGGILSRPLAPQEAADLRDRVRRSVKRSGMPDIDSLVPLKRWLRAVDPTLLAARQPRRPPPKRKKSRKTKSGCLFTVFAAIGTILALAGLVAALQSDVLA